MSERYDREFHTAHLYVPGPLGDATLPCMARPMTALPLRDFTDAERAKLAAIEAAPAAEEAIRERVARALWEVANPAVTAIYPAEQVADLWAGSRGTPGGDHYRKQADAALAVLSGPSSDAVLPVCWDPAPALHVGGVLTRRARCELVYGHGGAHQASEGYPDFPMRWIHRNPDSETPPC